MVLGGRSGCAIFFFSVTISLLTMYSSSMRDLAVPMALITDVNSWEPIAIVKRYRERERVWADFSPCLS